MQHIESGGCSACQGQQRARREVYNFVHSHGETQGYLNRMLTDGRAGPADPHTYLYECPRCGQTFNQMHSLMVHMDAKHKGQVRLALGW